MLVPRDKAKDYTGYIELLEEYVLGHIFYEAKRSNIDAITEVFDMLPNDAFTKEKNKNLFILMKAIYALKGRIDTILIIGEANKEKQIDAIGGAGRVIDISLQYNPTTDLLTLTKELYEEHKRQELIRILENSLEKVKRHDYDNLSNVIGHIDTQIYRLSDTKSETIVDIPATAKRIIDRTDTIEKYGLIGYSWGIPKLDILTGGIEHKKTYVIGAVKKSGKTKFLINTLYHLVKQNVKTLFLSMEMGAEAITVELLSRFSEQSNNFLKAKLDKEIKQKFINSINTIKNVTIDTQSFLTINQIRNKIRSASQCGTKVIMLDYIQRMNFEYGYGHHKGRNEASVIAFAMNRIADFAREYNVAIVMLSQLANKAENEIPKVSDLKDSGGIGESVDCIILIDNEDRRKGNYGKKTNCVNLIVEQRSGASGLVETVVDLSMSKYLPLEDREEPPDFSWSVTNK